MRGSRCMRAPDTRTVARANTGVVAGSDRTCGFAGLRLPPVSRPRRDRSFGYYQHQAKMALYCRACVGTRMELSRRDHDVVVCIRCPRSLCRLGVRACVSLPSTRRRGGVSHVRLIGEKPARQWNLLARRVTRPRPIDAVPAHRATGTESACRSGTCRPSHRTPATNFAIAVDASYRQVSGRDPPNSNNRRPDPGLRNGRFGGRCTIRCGRCARNCTLNSIACAVGRRS
ncbi:hypothetical protein MB901379_02607 [Mycobacterium basiliense]|uniref:Uncharacterized protein n=1 Tax=Mycobacterium basiliense TaxID=2094119 RepID=A0A447GEW0_9MYCO|nr:hypothetical protein MB901379_02607 [Mycobacterium basiliense]